MTAVPFRKNQRPSAVQLPSLTVFPNPIDVEGGKQSHAVNAQRTQQPAREDTRSDMTVGICTECCIPADCAQTGDRDNEITAGSHWRSVG